MKKCNENENTLEISLQDCSDRVDTVINDLLPKVCNKMKELSTGTAIKILDNDIHDRKWSLIINGLFIPKTDRIVSQVFFTSFINI